ncbi:MAG: FAD-dependent thymidylate synthase [Thermodesulfobacteriota bacterium]|nr:FAD-dependent thymidylate synthase [Thermodesulfobacteriota bacterium]
MKVSLINHTPCPEKTVEASAKLCYSPDTISNVCEKTKGQNGKSLSRPKGENFLKNILDRGHHSVLEHAVFTFGAEGISRACSHQLVRHRLASYSQQSQRYVKLFDNFTYITPPSIKKHKETESIYHKGIKNIHKIYKDLIETGIEPEDARYILPSAAETKIIISMNARELLHFFKLRCCLRAQWEIQGLAMEMLKLVKKAAPVIFTSAGPSCITGKCPEGKESCGREKEIKAVFKKL